VRRAAPILGQCFGPLWRFQRSAASVPYSSRHVERRGIELEGVHRSPTDYEAERLSLLIYLKRLMQQVMRSPKSAAWLERPRRRTARRLANITALGAFATLIAGCGGGSSGGIFIKSMEASPSQYGKTTTVTVTGFGLNEGITLSADQGCENVSAVTGGDNLTRRFTCTIVATGALTVRVITGTGREVGRLDFNVPQPQVTLLVEDASRSLQQIVMEFDAVRAPLSVRNVLAYVNARFYDGVIFHRADPSNGVVQTGGYTPGPTFKAATRAAIPLESNNGLTNLRATIGMARTSAPDSATSQFYFNVRDNPDFDYESPANPGYAVFGAVIQGMGVVDAIFASPTRVAPVLDSDGSPILDSDGRPFALSSVPQVDFVIRSALQTR